MTINKMELEKEPADVPSPPSPRTYEVDADGNFNLGYVDNGNISLEDELHTTDDSVDECLPDDSTDHSDPLLTSYNLANDDAKEVDTSISTSSSSNNNFSSTSKEDTKLLITFLLMLLIGTANKIFQKLQAIPMYNYPNSLNLLQNFVYVPLCFMYILPVSRFGLFGNAIPHEVSVMSKKPFVVMGLLDCVTCMLLTFAAVYLPGSLLILLPQAAIPISMVLSKRLKGETYAMYQYMGAVVVILGICVVLEPLVTQRHSSDYVCEAFDEEEFCSLCGGEVDEEGCLSHRTINSGGENDLLGVAVGERTSILVEPWKMDEHHVTLRSLVGSALQSMDTASSASATGDDHDGAICQWIPSSSTQSSSTSESTTTLLIWSIITIIACIPMTLSSIYKEMALSGSQTNIDPIFLNGWVAFYQFLFSFPLAFPAGMMSSPAVTPAELPSNIWDGIKCYLGISTITTGCHPDDQCHEAPFYVNMFLMFNVCFNILIVYILKYGSANVLFMAGTVMVPFGNLAFALPFMPGSMPLHDSDVIGLLVILFGLVTYRFGIAFKCGIPSWRTIPPLPWRRGKNWYRRNPAVVLNEKMFEWNAPVYDESEDDLAVGSTSQLAEPLLLSPLD